MTRDYRLKRKGARLHARHRLGAKKRLHDRCKEEEQTTEVLRPISMKIDSRRNAKA